MRSYSFPFLNIARQFGVDYGDLLAVADAFSCASKPGVRARAFDAFHRLGSACLEAIRIEAAWQGLIADGVVAYDAPLDTGRVTLRATADWSA
jgi:hypothetical protein